MENGECRNTFALAQAIKIAASGRIASNLPAADLHLNFPLSTFNFQLKKPLFKTLTSAVTFFDSLRSAQFCADLFLCYNIPVINPQTKRK